MPSCAPPLSVGQVVEMTGMSKSAVLREIASKALIAHKLPGRTGAYLIYQADLEAYLAERLAAYEK